MHALLLRLAAGLSTPSETVQLALGAALPRVLSAASVTQEQRHEFVTRLLERVRRSLLLDCCLWAFCGSSDVCTARGAAGRGSWNCTRTHRRSGGLRSACAGRVEHHLDSIRTCLRCMLARLLSCCGR